MPVGGRGDSKPLALKSLVISTVAVFPWYDYHGPHRGSGEGSALETVDYSGALGLTVGSYGPINTA